VQLRNYVNSLHSVITDKNIFINNLLLLMKQKQQKQTNKILMKPTRIGEFSKCFSLYKREYRDKTKMTLNDGITPEFVTANSLPVSSLDINYDDNICCKNAWEDHVRHCYKSANNLRMYYRAELANLHKQMSHNNFMELEEGKKLKENWQRVTVNARNIEKARTCHFVYPKTEIYFVLPPWFTIETHSWQI